MTPNEKDVLRNMCAPGGQHLFHTQNALDWWATRYEQVWAMGKWWGMKWVTDEQLRGVWGQWSCGWAKYEIRTLSYLVGEQRMRLGLCQFCRLSWVWDSILSHIWWLSIVWDWDFVSYVGWARYEIRTQTYLVGEQRMRLGLCRLSWVQGLPLILSVDPTYSPNVKDGILTSALQKCKIFHFPCWALFQICIGKLDEHI